MLNQCARASGLLSVAVLLPDKPFLNILNPTKTLPPLLIAAAAALLHAHNPTAVGENHVPGKEQQMPPVQQLEPLQAPEHHLQQIATFAMAVQY